MMAGRIFWSAGQYTHVQCMGFPDDTNKIDKLDEQAENIDMVEPQFVTVHPFVCWIENLLGVSCIISDNVKIMNSPLA